MAEMAGTRPRTSGSTAFSGGAQPRTGRVDSIDDGRFERSVNGEKGGGDGGGGGEEARTNSNASIICRADQSIEEDIGLR